MKKKNRLKKRDKKWKSTQTPVEDTDALRLQRELLGIELCVQCQHTYPRELGVCPSCS
jgi:hypothetical protein